ncbi:hypothetical protein GA0070624_6005 [Micromonospora rhizosphaerae]|uniref:Uncharacterized protein n=1 Tax=Micromonospora rhizosphaerae TaxID=568872 RepID=A0A1C6T7U5_9ACTN|nr:hypothetical protein [Micromonospora rhizosphaerae]SCL37828.1 hypothetical protein GA0070624_6005 [Micromonospora rhizosphaerae]
MDATTAVPVWHTSAIARLVWGGTLSAVPRRVLRRLGRPTGLAVATLRVLGVRHLAQAALTLRRPTPAVLTVGAAADGLHALTAVALAGVDRRQRRLALLDTAIAGGWMLLDLGAARHPRRWTGRRTRLRGLGQVRSGRGGRR